MSTSLPNQAGLSAKQYDIINGQGFHEAIISLLVSYLYKLLFFSFYIKLDIFVLGSLKQCGNWKRNIHFDTSESKYASENTHAHTHASFFPKNYKQILFSF